MTTTITIAEIVHEVVPCEDITITDHTLGDDGMWVREFRFYGESLTEDSTELPLLLTVRVKNTTKSKIDATAPPQIF